MIPTALYSSVCAGSPSPVDNGEDFDLASYLVRHPEHTFFVKVSGQSMIGCGIEDGDILIVDKSLAPRQSDVVIAQVDGSFTVKQFKREHGRLRLVPANSDYSSIEIGEDARICGVALFAIKRLFPALALATGTFF
jgi:DNA polymerase V